MFRISIILILAAMLSVAWYVYSAEFGVIEGGEQVATVIETVPEPHIVVIPHKATRREVAGLFGDALGWDEHKTKVFASTYAQMQWASLNDEVISIFSEFVEGDVEALQRLSESSSKYFEPEYDLLSTVHASGTYEIEHDATHPEVAAMLVHRLESEQGDTLVDFTKETLEPDAASAVLTLIKGERELLPDLVPLPPRDVVLQETTTGWRLAFSTTYYNQGEGPLELRADPATIYTSGDISRSVAQRIYRENGTYVEKPSGIFFWHEPHVHYHFADFVLYEFEPVEVADAVDLDSIQQKSTFCVRDISTVNLELEFSVEEAAYQICGRERQGISVGWGDTYFFTYPDQNIDVSGFPSGTYRLTFTVNPENRFTEITTENNISSALFQLDMEKGTVSLIKESPESSPAVEHIYEE